MLKLEDLVRWSGAAPEGPLPDSFPSLSTDTRDLPPGCLFLALRGEKSIDAAELAYRLTASARAVKDDAATRAAAETAPRQ